MKNDYKKYDFWTIKKNGETKFYIRVDIKWFEVSKQVYATCRNSYRKILRDNERDKDVIYHYDNLGITVFHSHCTESSMSIDIIESIYKKMQNEKLYTAIDSLSIQEKEIINLIYFEEKTEREVATTLQLSNSTLHNKKIRILKKLNKILKQKQF